MNSIVSSHLIKGQWVGEWLKVPQRYYCSALECSAATYSPYFLILPIAASYAYSHVGDERQIFFYYEKIND